MTTDDLDLRGTPYPELIFGLVAPFGCPLDKITELLRAALANYSYTVEEIHLSKFFEAYTGPLSPEKRDNESAYEKYSRLMDWGNQLRKIRTDFLAMQAAVHINRKRPDNFRGPLERQAFVLRQLKHPDEVRLLRQVYGDSFHLIGVDTPEHIRRSYLRNILDMSPEQADALIKRDAGEHISSGQQVTKTFHLADLIVDTPGYDDVSLSLAEHQIKRYIDLLFGRAFITPTVDEYGMFLAYAASLRSADLSRQVGAAILSPTREVISLGTNEVPRAGGGQYWSEDPDDNRDFKRGYDANERMELAVLKEVLEHVKGNRWRRRPEQEKTAEVRALAEKLSNIRIMNLTEFGRPVHAEMEAILAAARIGQSVRGSTLYTTTFPCHNCAKHIVGAGIANVVYIEPYPKSLARDLHDDAITFSFDSTANKSREGKVVFRPFVGVTPRRYPELFSMIGKDGVRLRRKVAGGASRTEPLGLRLGAYPLTHIDRETMVASFLRNIVPPRREEEE